MAQFNIDRTRSYDHSYRYKMPAIISKTTPVPKFRRRLQTELLNLEKVAKSLPSHEDYLLKHLSTELACIQKNKSADRQGEKVFLLMGQFTSKQIQDALDSFIDTWVLCQTCQLPETTLDISKSSINQNCNACSGSVELNNQPTKNARIVEKYMKSNPQKIKSKWAEKEENKNKIKQTTISPVINTEGWEDDDEYTVDTTEVASIARYLESMQDSVGLLTDKSTSMSNFSLTSRISNFTTFCRDLKTNHGDKYLTKCHVQVVQRANQVCLGPTAVKILITRLLKLGQKKITARKLIDQLEMHKKLLQDIVFDAKCQRELVNVLCLVISKQRKNLLKYSPHIIKWLYDFDIVDEDVILQWSSGIGYKYVEEKFLARIFNECEEFFRWLEDDSEDEDEKEEDEEKDETKSYEYYYGEYKYVEEDEEQSSEIDIDAI